LIIVTNLRKKVVYDHLITTRVSEI